jgi:O-methyltransferase
MAPWVPPHSLVGEETIRDMLHTARSTPPGCFVEVGVYKGGTGWFLARLSMDQHRRLYLYDTFSGIPYEDAIDPHHIGDFADTSFEAVRALIPRAITIPGVFPNSAVPMPPIAFAHLDCDQYRSVKESADYLIPRMVPKGVIWFDDSPCLAGAHKAAVELFGDRLQLSETGKHFVEI